MTYEMRCPDCQNTNGEHKPGCRHFDPLTELFDCRKIDLEDALNQWGLKRA